MLRLRANTKINKMKSQESKSVWATPNEKANHYTYLKDFRVEQCQLFLQHKCTQHRPYTCFNWHFLNQKRRRPVRKRDGVFNYSPDNYCTKFDENTGICPDGDECALLHRTAGDTERRYHLRYYKTGMCVHETDSRGMCIKNGPHCAFAHGVDDVRPPVYDIWEQQALESGEHDNTNGGPNSLDKERNMINEDPKWQDTTYVLANYKTETCKRPPRLCRQGYACPQYHNSRDKRRPPRKFKYRSTACPNVKHGDEWGEPGNCDSGDQCQYCHTRTEQQFHPEIYKSTKCNDIHQSGYCPRGAFCAFAHVDQEMTQVRETASMDPGGTSLAEILHSALPENSTKSNLHKNDIVHSNSNHSNRNNHNGTSNSNFIPIGKGNNNSKSGFSVLSKSNNSHLSHGSTGLPPIGSKSRRMSGSALNNGSIIGSPPASILEPMISSLGTLVYPKAPGSERERVHSCGENWGAAIISGSLPDTDDESATHQQSVTLLSSSPLTVPFYSTCDTVQSVIGALDDLNLEESITLGASLERDYDAKHNSITNSISNSLNSAIGSGFVDGSSRPVNIPGSTYHERMAAAAAASAPMMAHSNSPPSTCSPGFAPSFLIHNENSFDQNSYMRSNGFMNTGIGSVASPPEMMASASPQVSVTMTALEAQRLRDELLSNRRKMASWEEGMAQARTACQAWKREADEAKGKAQLSEHARDELVSKCTSQQKDIEDMRHATAAAAALGSVGITPFLQSLHPHVELGKLPMHTLKALQGQLKRDLLQVEKVISDLSLKNDPWPGVVRTW